MTDNGHLFTQGSIRIDAYDKETQDLLESQTYDLSKLEVEAFWGVEFEEEPEGRELELVITGEEIQEGPSVWLNTETQTQGSSYENGQVLSRNLIYNAVYRTQVHYVKKPFLMTLMLLLLGGMFFLVAGKKKEETKAGEEAEASIPADRRKKAAAIREKLSAWYQKYRLWLGLGFLLFLVALIFFYVYDGPIRKAMNSTHRVVVMKDNNALLSVTKDTQDLVQYYTTEEEELVGLGVRMDLAEDFVAEGSIQARVTDITTGELLCTAEVPASSLLDGQYVGLIFEHSQQSCKGHVYEISLHFTEELLDRGLSVIVTPEGYYKENELYVNGEEQDYRLSMNAHTYFNLFLKKYFFAMFLFFELMAAGFYYLAFIRRCRIEQVFLVTILCLGVI